MLLHPIYSKVYDSMVAQKLHAPKIYQHLVFLMVYHHFPITFPSLSHHFPIGILEEASVDWNGSEVIL